MSQKNQPEKTISPPAQANLTASIDQSNNRTAKVGFLMFFGLMLILNILLFKTMIHPIIFGAILAGTFAPLFQLIIDKTKWKREICSGITCFIILIVVVIPLTYIIIQLSKESLTAYRLIRDGLSKEQVNDFLFGEGQIALLIRNTAELFNLELTPQEVELMLLDVIRNFSGYLLNMLNSWAQNMALLLFDFIIMMLVIFALFNNGPRLKKYLFKLSPLPNEQEELIVNKFNQMNYVTLVCNGIGGILQGGLAAVGFYLAGIPSLFLWFSLMVILAFIPLVGISFITVPASVYLMLSGEVATGVSLLLYCAAVSLIVENWFKPIFIGSRIKVNSLLVLLYIIGGMAIFGMAGIFYGPLICILFLTVVELYHDYYADDFNRN